MDSEGQPIILFMMVLTFLHCVPKSHSGYVVAITENMKFEKNDLVIRFDMKGNPKITLYFQFHSGSKMQIDFNVMFTSELFANSLNTLEDFKHASIHYLL